ncbi:MAG: right-handed parallel beta-helix repeat-containing protein [Gemmatimonadales bacterium]|nr:right-handed parallel beta-helix repeat-containing protein [Gemmatimonadales bacterium]
MAPRVTSLAAAVHLVRDGGTVVVEDGVWETDGVIIDKPLTMKSAPPAEPLLINTNPDGPGLTIDGVAQGTVELQGLRFENAAGLSAILATGTYDRVVIRNSHVEVTSASTEAGWAYGINATTSTVPDGQLIVENTTFVGGRFGVIAQGTTAHVRGSRFTECSVASVQYTLASRGTIEHNEIDGCGSNACITVFDPAGIEIANNGIRHPVGAARNGIRALVSNPGSYAVSIRDNELVGTGVQPDDLDPYPPDGDPFGRDINASALRYGIRVTGTVIAAVQGNRVSGAHWGVILHSGGSGTIIGNRVWDCGGICIFAGQVGTPTVIEGNLVLGDVGFRRAGTAIFARSQAPWAPVTIRHNTVVGNRNDGDPADLLSYAFKMGILALSWNPWDADPGPEVPGLPVEVYGNTVTNVGQGLVADLGGFMVAHDNVLDGMGQGLLAWHWMSTMQAHRNDFLDAAIAALGYGSIFAQCNWWGSAGGPGTAWDPQTVTPWATEPIANRPTVQCPVAAQGSTEGALP